MRKISGLLAVAALAACQASRADTPKPKTEPPPSTRFEHDMMVRFHMHQNFDLLRAVERLLIRGKLDDAKRFAEAIGSAADEPGQGPWATHTAQVRERAAALARATTVEDALRKEAHLAAACGNCHGELGVSPEFKSHPAAPSDQPTIPARMARHRWAVDRMWEGVVGNASDPWREGLEVLAATPVEVGPERGTLARTLQKQAEQARRPNPGPMQDRPTTYGEILVVCASCHTLAPKKP